MKKVLQRSSSRISYLKRQNTNNSFDTQPNDILINNAIDLYNRGNLSRALICFESLKESYNSDTYQDRINKYLSEIYQKLGKENSKSKNFILALSFFEKLKLITEKKNDPKALQEVLEHLAETNKCIFFENKEKQKYLEAVPFGQKQKEIYKKLGKPVEEVNLELSDMFSILASQFLAKGKLRLSLEFYEKLKEIFIEKDHSKGLLDLYPILGELYFEISEVRKAVMYFNKLRDLAEAKEDYKRKMYAFQHIGICYQIVRDYKSALKNFKLLLQLAWKLKNIEMELVAYDYMSIQYFYLGDLDGAQYYHNRIWKGITEKFTSPTREISNKSLEALKNRETIPVSSVLEKPVTRIDGFNIEVPEVNIGLPSPRTSSGKSDIQLLPSQPKKLPTKNLKSKVRIPSVIIRTQSTFKHSSSKSLSTTLESKNKLSESKKKIKPFILLSHLSPMESVKNFLYADQIK